VTPSGVARQLGPLERMGVVGRESNPADARLALVVLTPTGERVADEAVVTARDAADRAFARLWTPAERERLGALLARAAPG
jgi:DNA-binding MarR family transcriptional regulator